MWRRYLRFQGPEVAGDVDEELEFHLEMRTRALMERGLSGEAARAEARRRFGDPERIRREVVAEDEGALREGRRRDWWGGVRADVRFAVRVLRRAPVTSLLAVLTLALGIGVNTAVFSAANGVLLRPLPFADPERLVALGEDNAEKDWTMQIAAVANYLDWREQVPAFRDVAAYADFDQRVTITGLGDPHALHASTVSGNFFDVLGVRPLLGRGFRMEESWSDAERVVVLSHAGWTREFGADPGVVGRSVRLDGREARIVGVMPPRLAFPHDEVDLWTTFRWEPSARGQEWFRRAHWVRPIARLRPGVSQEEASAQFQAVVRRLQERYPSTNRGMGAHIVPLHRFLVGDTRAPLLVLLGAVGVLLLLACANVGNLLLVRAAGRARELALRDALGAGRGRLVRQLLTESLVLSAAGGALGLLLGWLGTRALDALRPAQLLHEGQLGMDLRVVAFGVAATLVSGVLFGLLPALWSARAPLVRSLRDGSRAVGLGRGARRLSGALVAGEVAMSLLLLAGAGLLVRSYQRLQQVDPGFDDRGVLTFTVRLPGVAYETEEEITSFYDRLVRGLEAVPGVRRAAATSGLPLTSLHWTSDFSIAGRGREEYGSEVAHRTVTPGYFGALHEPLLRGRGFTDADRTGSAPVVIVNEELARRFFPGQDPVGQRLSFDRYPDSTSVWRTVVGVVGSERQTGLAEPPHIEIFSPFGQEGNGTMTLVVRGNGDPMALVPAVRRTLAALDPTLVPYDVRPLSAVREESVARERFLTLLLGTFAAVSLRLALVGVYGVLAQLVRERRAEMGVRLALGARPGQVVGLVVRQGARLLAVGVVVGLAAALAATRALSSLLYGVTPTDPPTLAAGAVLISLAGLAAVLFPALTASRTRPSSVLRSD
jgi:predicted permease